MSPGSGTRNGTEPGQLPSLRCAATSHATSLPVIARRASILEPIRRMTSDGGPTNTRPAASHAAANAAFSERKP